jgi:Fe-S-cluster containining protein
MHITRRSTIIATEDKVEIETPLDGGRHGARTILYKDDEGLRDAMRRLVNALVERHKKELFAEVCTRCGRCCMERSVTVTAREIQRIGIHTHIAASEKLMSQHFGPALTWNDQDGVLKHVNNHCMFLKKRASRSDTCRIYTLRPAACAAFEPSEICAKDRGRLTRYLAKITLEGDMLSVETTEKLTREKSLKEWRLEAEAENIRKRLEGIAELPPETSDSILAGADACLGDLRRMYFNGGESREFQDKVAQTREIAKALHAESDEGKEELRRLSRSVDRLMDLAEGPPRASQKARSHYPSVNDAVVLAAMRFEPETLLAVGSRGPNPFKIPLALRQHRSLLPLVRSLLSEIVHCDDDVIAAALEHIEPTCFMCGECCRCFGVELTSDDIVRIADHFRITEKEVWKRYLQPSIYTWNDSHAIFKKRQGSSGDERGGVRQCIFLEKKSPRIYACGIYEARPEICRVFSARTEKCREMSRRLNGESHGENIIRFDVIGEELLLTTRLTSQHRLRPLALDLMEWRKMSDLCQQIRAEVIKIVER